MARGHARDHGFAAARAAGRRPPELARRGLRDGRLPRLGHRAGLIRPRGRRGHQRRGRGAGAGRGARRRVARGAGARSPVRRTRASTSPCSTTCSSTWTSAEVDAGLRELRRVLRPDGVLLVRTNGGRHARRERADWRLYDAGSLEGRARGGRLRRPSHHVRERGAVDVGRGPRAWPDRADTHDVRDSGAGWNRRERRRDERCSGSKRAFCATRR